MTSYSESTLAEENGGTVFAMLDNQSLRPHGQDLPGGAWEARFLRHHLHLAIIDHQHVHQLQPPAKLRIRALNPAIHGGAAGQLHVRKIETHSGLQRRMYVCQEKKLRVFVFRWNTRLKFLEHVQFGEISFGLVEIVEIF